ncbi:NIPSNAP family protein [Neisseriaceae bacterium JH1-16]|nr:NIPSNAP family protein [Neisseriaceae bacterium JH1-16]
MTRTAAPLSHANTPEHCTIVELRQYTLHQGARDDLVALFDREFVESQEALSMTVLGQFRDLDDPNRFVWLRGFADMTSRAPALAAFYGGPVWKAHRETANATMIDSDNVLLLRPARPASGFAPNRAERRLDSVAVAESGLLAAIVLYFDAPVTEAFVEFFEQELQPVLTEAGAAPLAHFVTEHAENNFPALPVREGESVFVWFAAFADLAAYQQHVVNLERSPRWNGEIATALAQWLTRVPEVIRLAPTARSRLRA